jgi:hypothetical protein
VLTATALTRLTHEWFKKMILDGIFVMLVVVVGMWSARLSIKSAIENTESAVGAVRYLLFETYIVTGIVCLLWFIGWADVVVMTMMSVRFAELLCHDYNKLFENYHTLKQGKN